MVRPSCFIKPSGKPVIHINSEKRVYGEKVLNMVIETIERAIKFAPDNLAEVKNNVIPYFADIIYDEDGVNRLLSFEQFGSFYIAKVYDKYSENKAKYTFVAYSVYDIFDYYNGNLGNTIPYVNLGIFLHDTDYTVSHCDKPCAYKNATLNESNKFIITFIDKSKGVIDSTIELFVNETEISASQKYIALSSIGIAKRVAGYVTYVINGTRFSKNYSITVKELEGKEYAYFWDELRKANATEIDGVLDGKNIVGWEYYNDDQGEETYLPKLTDLERIKVKNGVAVFVAVLTDEIEDDFEFGDDEENEDFDPDFEMPEDSSSGEEGEIDLTPDDNGESTDIETGSNDANDKETENDSDSETEGSGTEITDESSEETSENTGTDSSIDGEESSETDDNVSEENKTDIIDDEDFEISNDREYDSDDV